MTECMTYQYENCTHPHIFSIIDFLLHCNNSTTLPDNPITMHRQANKNATTRLRAKKKTITHRFDYIFHSVLMQWHIMSLNIRWSIYKLTGSLRSASQSVGLIRVPIPSFPDMIPIYMINLILIIISSLIHWDRVTHICVNKLTVIGSDNGLSPDRRQAIIWTNAGILLIGPLGTNFSEILIGIHTFSFKKMHLKMSSGKCRPFCLGLNVLKQVLSLTDTT